MLQKSRIWKRMDDSLRNSFARSVLKIYDDTTQKTYWTHCDETYEGVPFDIDKFLTLLQTTVADPTDTTEHTFRMQFMKGRVTPLWHVDSGPKDAKEIMWTACAPHSDHCGTVICSQKKMDDDFGIDPWDGPRISTTGPHGSSTGPQAGPPNRSPLKGQ